MTIKSSGGNAGVPVLDYHISEDFGDGNYSGRVGGDSGIYAAPDHEAQSGRFLQATHRPEWSNPSGYVNVENEVLVLYPNNSGWIVAETPSSLHRGEWSGTFKWRSGGDDGGLFTYIMYEDIENYVNIQHRYNGVHRLITEDDDTASALIDSTWSPTTSTTDWKVTRTPYGEYEMITNGSSRGTAVDAYLPETNRVRVMSNAVSEIEYRNLVVR